MQEAVSNRGFSPPRRAVLALATVVFAVTATLLAPRALASANAIPGRVECDQYVPYVYLHPPGVRPRALGAYWQQAWWTVTWYEQQTNGFWKENDTELFHSGWFPKDTTGFVNSWFADNGRSFGTNGILTETLNATHRIVVVYTYWWKDFWSDQSVTWASERDVTNYIQC